METLLVFAFGALFVLVAFRALWVLIAAPAPWPVAFDLIYGAAVGVYLIIKSGVLS
jgi:hypothetical protein